MSLSPTRLSRNTVFVILLMLSGLALLLPADVTDKVKHVVQFVVPVQDLARTAAWRAARHIAGTDGPEDAAAIREPLLHELGSLHAQSLQLEQQLAQLRALRDRQLPPSVPLLDARIVARDVASWRDTALVSRGSLRGAGWRDWVASRFFVDRGAASEVDSGQAVLARECLIGRIELVSPYMSRVQLLTDIDSPRLEVRIAAVDGASAEIIDYACSIRGIGRGRMAIENVESAYIDTATEAEARERGPHRIRVGDLVYSAPGQLGLPVPMAVGRITEITENPKKRLVHTLNVEPLVSLDELRDVFIIPLVPAESLQIP